MELLTLNSIRNNKTESFAPSVREFACVFLPKCFVLKTGDQRPHSLQNKEGNISTAKDFDVRGGVGRGNTHFPPQTS